MALIPASGVVQGEDGQTTMRPTFRIYITIPGDAAYTAADGSEIETVVRKVVGHAVNVNYVHGYGVLTAAPTAITHLVRYKPSTKAIFLNTIAAGAAQADANLSTSTLHLYVEAN
jgi:hypothetical protein